MNAFFNLPLRKARHLGRWFDNIRWCFGRDCNGCVRIMAFFRVETAQIMRIGAKYYVQQ